MFNLNKLIILCVFLAVALRVESVQPREKISAKHLVSFINSLTHIITAGKAPGEMSITPNTLGCLMTVPFGFKKACLEAYQNRMKPLGLNYDSRKKEDQLGELAFLALEDICSETVKKLIKALSPVRSNAARELESLLIRGDILCFISYADIPDITPKQLAAEIKAMTDKHGFMSKDEAKLQILLNHYNLLPKKCPIELAALKKTKSSNLAKILSTCYSFGDGDVEE